MRPMRAFRQPPDRELGDELLFDGYAAGDEALAVAFVRRFQSAVFGVALAVTSDPRSAEDVAQRCFERAWAHAASYDARRGSVRTWLVAIAHHVAVDAVRAHRATPVDPEAGDALRAALAALPAEQARAVVLAAVHGYTAREIADQEDVPLGTAKTRIRAGVIKLNAALVPGRSHD
jgi:DNA-directed RNA polymerase specialized sigma24 family protein